MPLIWREKDGDLVTYTIPDSSRDAFRALDGAGRKALAVKIASNATRLRALGVKAAKYARDPGGNPALTTREINELLARLVLAETADDQ